MKTKASSNAQVAALLQRTTGAGDCASGGGVFHLTCHDKDGNLKWQHEAKNLVVDEGLQDMNTQYFTGSTYTAAWYLGLISGASAPTLAAGDTLASHAGWTEITAYSGDRKAVTFGAATAADPSVIDNDASQAQFVMTGTETIAGAFLANVDTGSSGVLFSEAVFESPGDRSVVSGDILNVKYTFSLADA
jgi:hypothetical protein